MIYNGYAFSKNELQKAQENRDEYKRLKEKYRVLKTHDAANIRDNDVLYNADDYDVIYKRYARYGHGEYHLIKKPDGITEVELLLIFDEGNLCFGGRKLSGNVYLVSED